MSVTVQKKSAHLCYFSTSKTNANTRRANRYYRMSAGFKAVRTVLGRLKAQGLLVEPDNPRARICRDRDESDLRILCLEHGLQPTGNADQLADRLLTIDPTGWLLGYAEELLQCAELVDRTRVAPRSEPCDYEATWEMFTRQAQRSAREGNLALCRNVHLMMANHLLRRNKRAKALQALCIVCVFDLCGVRFGATCASLAPWLVSRVRNLSRELALSMEGLREIFLRVGTRLPVPKDSRELWAVLERALEEASD